MTIHSGPPQETTDQQIINQTDLGRIRAAIEELGERIGKPAYDGVGEAIGGSGLIGDFNRFRVKAEKRFSIYDRGAWVLTGAAGAIAMSAACIWFLVQNSEPVQGLRAGPAQIVGTRK